MANKPVTVPKGFLKLKVYQAEAKKAAEQAMAEETYMPLLTAKAKPTKPAAIKDVAKPAMQPLGANYADIIPGTVTLTLPSELGEKLLQPIKGQGGWQTLMGSIQTRMHTSAGAVDDAVGYQLMMTPALLKQMVPYAIKYGAGGYQGTIRHILSLFVSQQLGTIVGTMTGKGE